MFASAGTYVLFVSSFIHPNAAFILLASVLVGVGAAGLWVAEGLFITANSTIDTQGRNSAIFKCGCLAVDCIVSLTYV